MRLNICSQGTKPQSFSQFYRLHLKDLASQSQGIPCVLQKLNKDGSLSEEPPGLTVIFRLRSGCSKGE